jgi:hypothetical protein
MHVCAGFDRKAAEATGTVVLQQDGLPAPVRQAPLPIGQALLLTPCCAATPIAFGSLAYGRRADRPSRLNLGFAGFDPRMAAGPHPWVFRNLRLPVFHIDSVAQRTPKVRVRPWTGFIRIAVALVA